jgi:hypothetical protein
MSPPVIDRRVRARVPVHGSRLQTALLVLVAVVALAGAGVAVWYKLAHKPQPEPADPASQFADLNLSLEAPPSPWARDEEARKRLGSPYKLAYRRDNPEAVMAIGAQDFGTRSPRAGELRRGLTEALGRVLEPGTLTEHPPQETTWMGQPVAGFKFTGQLRTGPAVEGEAYAVAHRGFGYWFLAWTGENEIYQEQKPAFAAARQKCKPLDLRQDWQERQAPVVTFKNSTLGYAILDAEGIWREVTDEELVKGEDPRADKLLTAELRQKGQDIHPRAELTVYALDAAADPLAAARAYVEAQATARAELFGKTAFTEYAEKPEGDPLPDAVEGTAPFVVLRATNERDPNQSRLWVVSAIKVQTGEGEKVVAVAARCLWRERARFDTRLVQIARSLHSTGG